MEILLYKRKKFVNFKGYGSKNENVFWKEMKILI
jgi:hypothetical protein